MIELTFLNDICHCWYFLDEGFKFQPDVCHGCYDCLMMSINLSDIAIVIIHGAGILVLLAELVKVKQ